MKREILKFHYEEIVFVLMILNSNLSSYHEDDLKNFAEAIARLDSMSTPAMLTKLKLINQKIDANVTSKLILLQNTISKLYTAQWYLLLAKESEVLNQSHQLSEQVLKMLNEVYIEPLQYAEKNMNFPRWESLQITLAFNIRFTIDHCLQLSDGKPFRYER